MNFQNIYKLRKLFLNFSVRSAANLFSKLLGLITLPIITRALGPEAYGNYNLVNIIVQYTSLPIGLLGLRSYGIREIAAKRKKPEYAMEILSMQFTMALFAVIISLIISYFIFKSNILFFAAIILGYIIVFARSFDLEFFFVSQKDLVFPTVAKIIGQLVYVMGVVFLIKKPHDFVTLVFLTSLSATIGSGIQLKKYTARYSRLKIGINFLKVVNTFRKTWRLGVSQNLEAFLGTIPQLILPIILGNYALGIYSGGFKIYSILVLFYVTFFYALAPYLTQINEMPIARQKRYHLIIFVVSFMASSILGLILFLFGEKMVLLVLGKSFGESVIVFKVISLTLIPLVPLVMLLGNILIYSNYEKYYLNALIIQGISLVITAPLMIKYFGVVGAVYALAISMAVVIGILFLYYLRAVAHTKNEI